MNYRNFATNNWIDDNMLSMSPEQKLLFVYLHTSPFSSACGIFKLQPKMMGFQIGFVSTPFESALKGLVGAFPKLVAVDWNTNEVALLRYPGQLLITASTRAMNAVAKDINQVESIYLLRALIAENSPSVTAAYRSRLNSLLMQNVNSQKSAAPAVVTAIFEEDLPRASPQQPAPDQMPSLPPPPTIPTEWEPTATYYIELIEKSPQRLLKNMIGEPKALPQGWKDHVKARCRHYLADGMPYMLMIPTTPEEKHKREGQMLIKIAQWIESPYNATKTEFPRQPVQVDIKVSEYKPKR